MALVLKKRGLLTRTYGVQNNAAPGDLDAIDNGSFTRRPAGPSIAGWDIGWSAHNLKANARHTFAIAAASGYDLKGMIRASYHFGPGAVAGGTGRIYILAANNALGGNEKNIFALHCDTMVLDAFSVNGKYPAQNGLVTPPRRRPFRLGIAWEFTPADNWVIRYVYKPPGGAWQILYTSPAFPMGGNNMVGAGGGTLWETGNSVIAARYGLPSLYQIDSIADATLDDDVIDQPDTPMTWYVRGWAAGTGKGYSEAEAWNGAQLAAEIADSNYTVLAGDVKNPATGAILDTSGIDADVLAARYRAGTALPSGDIIYLDDSAGPVRLTASATFSLCDGVRWLPLPSLGHSAEIRGTAAIAAGDWSLHAGNVYKATLANSYGTLFEFDSAPNSSSSAPRVLAHPTAANLAAYLAAATAGSFWSDGTTVYLWPTGSGNPATNGKTYEISIGNGMISVGCAGALFKDLIIRMGMTVDIDNEISSSPIPGLDGWLLQVTGTDLIVVDNVAFSLGGKHGPGTALPANRDKLRFVMLNSSANDCRPVAYDGGGGQSVLVNYGETNGLDNQYYFENVSVTTNVAVPGSTVGALSTGEAVYQEHTDAIDTDRPFSKGWFKNCSILGPISGMGSVTNTTVIDNNVLGMAGAVSSFGSTNGVTLTMTRNGITTIGLPSINCTTGTVDSNYFSGAGAIGTVSTVSGDITFSSNTVEASLVTGDATKALWTRGGVVALTMHDNDIKLNDGAAWRLLGTITPGSGDSLAMSYNKIEGSDASRILVTSYGGATKTLAQLQSGGQDTGSLLKTGALFAKRRKDYSGHRLRRRRFQRA